jgi:hypothetical protein
VTGLRLTSTAETGRIFLMVPAPVLWALLITLSCATAILWFEPGPEPSDIRVKNATGFPLTDVRINGVAYGDIGVGATTTYLKHKLASEWADYKFNIEGILLQSNPFLIVKTLGPGKFTYVIFASEPYDSHGRAGVAARGTQPIYPVQSRQMRHVWVRLERGE